MKKIKKALSVTLSACLTISGIPLNVFTVSAEETADYPIVVSLGDSYSSGEGILPFCGQEKDPELKVQDDDWLAHRSENAWPGQLRIGGDEPLAAYKNSRWFFAAASGAKAANVSSTPLKRTYDYKGYSGSKNLPAQLSVITDNDLKGKVDYVTITIGGNDIGFTSLITDTALASNAALQKEIDEVWAKFDAVGGTGDNIKQTYYDIAEAAGTQATIIVAGYPTLFSNSGITSKNGYLPVSAENSVTLNKAVGEFNDRLENLVNECQQEGMNICFVDVQDIFKGHEAGTDDPYINPIKLGRGAEDLKFSLINSNSVHPNEKGAAAYAAAVQEKIDSLSDHTITVEKTCHGKVEISRNIAEPGQYVDMIVTPDEGYELDTLRVCRKSDSREMKVTKLEDNKYRFLVPASVDSDYYVAAQFRFANIAPVGRFEGAGFETNVIGEGTLTTNVSDLGLVKEPLLLKAEPAEGYVLKNITVVSDDGRYCLPVEEGSFDSNGHYHRINVGSYDDYYNFIITAEFEKADSPYSVKIENYDITQSENCVYADKTIGLKAGDTVALTAECAPETHVDSIRAYYFDNEHKKRELSLVKTDADDYSLTIPDTMGNIFTTVYVEAVFSKSEGEYCTITVPEELQDTKNICITLDRTEARVGEQVTATLTKAKNVKGEAVLDAPYGYEFDSVTHIQNTYQDVTQYTFTVRGDLTLSVSNYALREHSIDVEIENTEGAAPTVELNIAGIDIVPSFMEQRADKGEKVTVSVITNGTPEQFLNGITEVYYTTAGSDEKHMLAMNTDTNGNVVCEPFDMPDADITIHVKAERTYSVLAADGVNAVISFEGQDLTDKNAKKVPGEKVRVKMTADPLKFAGFAEQVWEITSSGVPVEYTKDTDGNIEFTMPEGDVLVSGYYCIGYVSRNWDSSSNSIAEKEVTLYSAEPLSDAGRELSGGCYVLDEDILTDGYTLTGDVELILTDGKKLTSTDCIDLNGHKLTIYGQSDGTGTLVVKGKDGKSGINVPDNSTLNICGGVVNAEGSRKEWTQEEKISDGDDKITAVCRSGGAGIGSYGTYAAYGNINIYGGEVTAQAGYGAGIGGGICQKSDILYSPEKNDCGTVSFYGGKVTVSSLGHYKTVRDVPAVGFLDPEMKKQGNIYLASQLKAAHGNNTYEGSDRVDACRNKGTVIIGEDAHGKCVITFDTQGGSEIDKQTVDTGTSPQRPADPVRVGYIFKGWTIGDTNTEYDFSTISKDITVKAKWEKVEKNCYVGYSLSLGGSIGMNLYVILTEDIAKTGYAMVKGPGDAEAVRYDFKDMVLTKNGYKLTAAVYPYQMQEKPEFRIYDQNGEEVKLADSNDSLPTSDQSCEITVEKYLMTTLRSDDAKLRALGEAMMDYGAYAQAFFGHKDHHDGVEEGSYQPMIPTSDGITGVTKESVSEYQAKLEGTKPEGFGLSGCSLVLKDMTTLKLYYKTADGEPLENITLNGKTLVSIKENNGYSVSVANIGPRDLNTMYTIDFDGFKVSISPMSYVYNVLYKYDGDDSQQKLVDLCKALYKYSEAADSYFDTRDKG